MRSHSRARPASRHSRPMRLLAWVVLAALLAGCTKDVVRGPVDTRNYSVDLERLGARRIVADGLEMDSVVLSPFQWPLEGSIKSLFQGDFVGIIENFDLSFRASRLRDDTLERLFDEGYVPVFLRVRNGGSEAARFIPSSLVVMADKDTEFYPVRSDDLPARFKEIDWAQTGLGVVLAALVVVLILASAKEGRGGGGGILRAPNANFAVSGGGGRGRAYSSTARPSTKGLLRESMLQPGEVLEGFVFFQMDRTVVDWASARIEKLP